LATIVAAKIGYQSAVRLASIFQGMAWDIEQPLTAGATTGYGNPTYGTRYFELTIDHIPSRAT
jgi:hypothetical protein